MKIKIQKLIDKNFQGFICAECGRELKHAFSINGHGVYGSECAYTAAGISYTKVEKQIKEQMLIAKRWNDRVAHSNQYGLDFYIKEHGSIEAVQEIFYKYGNSR